MQTDVAVRSKVFSTTTKLKLHTDFSKKEKNQKREKRKKSQESLIVNVYIIF